MVTSRSVNPEATFVSDPLLRAQHQVTSPAHSALKVGTLSSILLEIATYLEISKEVLARELFG
jgi:hypothetical protein